MKELPSRPQVNTSLVCSHYNGRTYKLWKAMDLNGAATHNQCQTPMSDSKQSMSLRNSFSQRKIEHILHSSHITSSIIDKEIKHFLDFREADLLAYIIILILLINIFIFIGLLQIVPERLWSICVLTAKLNFHHFSIWKGFWY